MACGEVADMCAGVCVCVCVCVHGNRMEEKGEGAAGRERIEVEGG